MFEDEHLIVGRGSEVAALLSQTYYFIFPPFIIRL